MPPLEPSAVGVWLTPMPPTELPPGTPPLCELQYRKDPTIRGLHQARARQSRPATRPLSCLAPLHARTGARAPQATRHDWDRLHKEAGLGWGTRGIEQRPSGALAYTLGWHRMTDRLAAYVAARHAAPP
jgi:hypothetical protein